jgi:translation initiation factor 3 subunit E
MFDSKNDSLSPWDLTSKISAFLDLHMIFPLLEYIDSLIANGVITYSSSDVAAARMKLLKPTHMVDYAIEMYRESNGPDAPIPLEMENQKKIVFDKIEELRSGCKALDTLLKNEGLRVSFCLDTINLPGHRH